MNKKHTDILKRFYKKSVPFSNVMLRGFFTNRDLLLYDYFYENVDVIQIDQKKELVVNPEFKINSNYKSKKEKEIMLTIDRSKELQKFFKLLKSFRVMYKDGRLTLVCPNENILETNFKLGDIEFSVDIEYLKNALEYINTRESEMIRIATGKNYMTVSTYDSSVFVTIAFKVSHAWGGEKACFSTFQE